MACAHQKELGIIHCPPVNRHVGTWSIQTR